MRIRTKILPLLRSQPYSFTPFSARSSSQKCLAVTTLHDFASYLSAGYPNQLYRHLLLHSRIGKTLPDIQHATKTSQLLGNVRLLHKYNILSLVSGLYSRTELQKFGFKFSSRQFYTATRKAQYQIFTLSDYQRRVPPSRSPITQTTINLIIEYLCRNSRLSCRTSVRGAQIYYLEKPKRDIYYQLKNDHPNIQISLNTFYKLSPPNFKKSRKMTDMCQICVSGKKIKPMISIY